MQKCAVVHIDEKSADFTSVFFIANGFHFECSQLSEPVLIPVFAIDLLNVRRRERGRTFPALSLLPLPRRSRLASRSFALLSCLNDRDMDLVHERVEWVPCLKPQ